SGRYGFACQPNRKPEERNSPKTNLGSEGLASADRNNKATLLLTAPCLTLKSSARDLFPRMVKLQYADRETRTFDWGTRCQPAMTHGRSLFLYEYRCWVNNPTLTEFCFGMIGRADIEGSKSNVAMNAWLPQASYPCGNFSGTSSLKFRGTKGSIGHTFMVCIHTENQNQGDFCPFALLEISVLHESPLGHLRYGLTDVPPQPNSPPDNVFIPDQPAKDLNARSWAVKPSSASMNK
ncbi:hypothetical protein TWF970_001367, partial [Orbilia oligospora]